MKTYSLWQTSKKAERRIEIRNFNQFFAVHEKPNTLYATMRINPFYNCTDFDFWMHSDQKLNKAKLYSLFMQAKKMLIKSGNHNDSLALAININELM